MIDSSTSQASSSKSSSFTSQKIMIASFSVLTVASAVIATLGALSILPSPSMWVGSMLFVPSLAALAIVSCKRNSSRKSIESTEQSRSHDKQEVLQNYEIVGYEAFTKETLKEKISVTAEDREPYKSAWNEYAILEEAEVPVFSHYYANCDVDLGGGIRDVGWGCAWRCMQICASTSISHSFISLYQAFAMNQDIATHEWAEPSYAKKYFEAIGLSGELYLYGREEGTPKTPTEDCQLIQTFGDLYNKIKGHLITYKTPIMADDGAYAVTIVGIKKVEKQNSNFFILWIADPHKTNKKDGLYSLLLNSAGKKIESTGVDTEDNGIATAQIIDPERGWMLFFPRSKN